MTPLIDADLWSLLRPEDAAGHLDRLLRSPQVRPDQVAAVAGALPVPWSTQAVSRLAAWLPTGGPSGSPAPRALWDLWATATAPGDCRAVADLARGMITAATGDHGPALTTRASAAANLLTLRAVLHDTLSPTRGAR